MQCYTNSLNKSPPNTHRVQKCLQKLLRSMHKDRHHTIQHYKHLLETSMEQADREKEITIEHLADIDRSASEHDAVMSFYCPATVNAGQKTLFCNVESQNDFLRALT